MSLGPTLFYDTSEIRSLVLCTTGKHVPIKNSSKSTCDIKPPRINTVWPHFAIPSELSHLPSSVKPTIPMFKRPQNNTISQLPLVLWVVLVLGWNSQKYLIIFFSSCDLISDLNNLIG